MTRKGYDEPLLVPSARARQEAQRLRDAAKRERERMSRAERDEMREQTEKRRMSAKVAAVKDIDEAKQVLLKLELIHLQESDRDVRANLKDRIETQKWIIKELIRKWRRL